MEKTTLIRATPRVIYNDRTIEERRVIKERICDRCGITDNQFRSRLRGETKWKKLESEVFAEEFGFKITQIDWEL